MSVIILDLFGGGGGVGRCTREIVRQLATEREPTVLCGRSYVVDSLKERLHATPNLRLANLEQPKFTLNSLTIKFAARSQFNSFRMADALLQSTRKATSGRGSHSQEPILVNYPQMIAPPSARENVCVLLHDLNWRCYPGNFEDADLTDRNCRGWVQYASRVITNSDCTRDEVIEHYECPPEKVVSAPLAPFEETISQKFNMSKYLADLGLSPGRFCLYPGVWGLHKGHDTLTEALEISSAVDPIVVTCGMPLHGIDKAPKAVADMRRSLAARWDRLMAEKKLVVVGGCSECEIEALRAGCRSYVLPSHYEGFGFPLVEAIYQHRPALVSDIAAFREILSRYPQYRLATTFVSNSSTALAAALKRVACEPGPMPRGWQEDIGGTWSWQNTVQRILSALSSGAAMNQ